MYVIPYLLGPVGSPYSRVGVELTDSPYVALSMIVMTRMGKVALERLKTTNDYVRGIHSVCNLDPDNKYICHFPDEQLIISVNSNYGGNALLSKKCHALRLASVSARNEGWLAEHMFVIGVENPEGKVTYLTGGFPSASGKTNLAMLRPPEHMRNWKVWLISDDVAWIHLDNEGRFRAINPENGIFGVAPNINVTNNLNILNAIRKNTIFTNVALAEDGTPWWEGKGEPPSALRDWQGRAWVRQRGPAAHPNSRFTTPIHQYPLVSSTFDDPNGVPISAIMFGGRRANLVPLVLEASNWETGVLLAAMMKVETTPAAEHDVGVLRADPMAMRPFCGYNMGDYFRHWLSFSKKSKKLPKIYLFNAFRQGGNRQFLWPGYSENLRVLKWIIDRCEGTADAKETPLGYTPTVDSIDLSGLSVSSDTIKELLRVDERLWIQELETSRSFFVSFGEELPRELWNAHSKLKEKLTS